MQCTRFPESKQAQTQANRNHSLILTKIKRCFSAVSDISTFKRSFHCIMLVECSARGFQRRNKPRYTQIIIICRFWRKLSVISLPFEISRRLNGAFSVSCMLYVVHVVSSGETCPNSRKSQSLDDFDENETLFLSRLGYFYVETIFSLYVTFKALYTRFSSSKQAQIHANRNH